MANLDLKPWGIRVRKALIVSLIAPFFTVVSAPEAVAAPACIENTDFTRLSSDGAATVVYRFTNRSAECTYTLPVGLSSAAILAVGAGGGGGPDGGAGGGGGEIRYNASQSLSGVSSIDIWVGTGGSGGVWGGAGSGSGSASTVKWSGATQYLANGGGGAGGWNTTGPPGGSGGSGGSGGNANSNGQSGGFGPYSQCVKGASPTGTTPSNSITGSSVNYGGGGGGGFGQNDSGSPAFLGAAGGGTSGGRGANYRWNFDGSTSIVGATAGYAGTAFTGGGGGGGAACNSGNTNGTNQRTAGGAGGHGVVIIAFARISQSITFAPISDRKLRSGTFNVAPTSSSGLSVTLTSATPSICTVSGFAVTPVSVGTCTLNANQAGNNNYTAAAQVQQSFVLNSTTITYSANDGSGTTASQEISSIGDFALRSNTFSRTGFRFLRWDSLANGSGTSYSNTQSVSLSSDTTLFAIWTSSIQYAPNTATTTRAIESTTAVGSSANTTLSAGQLVKGSPISNGLVLHLDASDASTVSGSSWTNKVAGVAGAEAAATLVGSPTYNASEGAFSLNGSSQFFTLGTTNYLFNGALPFTLNLTFKTSDPNKNSCLIGNFNGNVGATYSFLLASGVLFATRNVSPWTVSGTTQIPAGEIVYASYSFDGSNMRVYLNGNLYATSALINSSVSHNGGARIGACQDNSASSRFFKGQIYNAQIYNRALSGTEITTNFDNLVPGRLVSKDNYTLGGWNTQSNGTGTTFGSISTDLAALPTPFFRVSAENYSGGTLSASVGGSNLSITKNGNPVLNTNSGGGFGANARFPTISGSTGDGFRLGNAEIPNYTFCGMARYKDLDSGVRSTRGRIFAHSSLVNWISGWYDGGPRNFFHDAWLVGPTSVADPNWHVVCDSGNRVFWDGVKQTVTQQVYTSLPPLAINWAGSGDNSHFEFTEAIVYNQALSDAEINTIFRYFENKFGLTNITTTASSATKFVPPSDYSSQGDTTLQATWVSRVTYDGNRQTSGVAPSTQTITNTGATVAGVGTLARSGFIFAGWNTAADGSGTRFAPGAALSNDGNKLLYAQWVIPVTLAAGAINPATLNPYMRLVASDYDATNKVWRDSSGNSRNVTRVIGSPTLVTTTGNGATKSFQTLAGGTSDKFYFDNDPISTNWTVFALSRYSGANNRARIITGNYAASAWQDSSANWLFGHWDGKAALAHYNGWVTATSTPAGLNLTDWVMSTAYPSNYRYNGLVRGTSGGTAVLPPLGINTWTGEQSDYEVAEVIIFNRTLTLSEIGQIEDYFDERYGLAYPKVGAYQTANTLAIGAGVGGRSETFTATNGLGTKTFSMSPSRSGMTLDTSTANSVVLVVSPVAATGTYTQTITATDLAGETSTHVITVTVSPSVKFDTSTATTLITTHRRGTALRLNTVFGVGSKIFTMTPVATGISLDTSTAASGFATLRVDTFTATGTYTQVITVTDDTRVRSTYTITILINAPPTISSTSAIVTSPILESLRLNLDAGDPASYSGSGTTWTDISGNSRNGSLISSPQFSSANGGILNFNGTSQYVTTPSVRSEVFTVEAWVRFNALNNNYACVVTNQYSTDKINYSICFWGNSTIRAGYHQAGTGWIGGQTGAFTPVVGTWYQLVYRVEKIGTNYIGSLFQNGNLVAGQTTSTIAPNNDQLVDRIGVGWNSGVFIDGSIPIVRIYSRALSATEINQNYNAISPRFSNNPSNAITITTTESVTASSSVFYAGLGTGNKTFAISNATAGISIDTSTVNTVRVNLANTLTATSTTVARSISQVITATDASGIAAATPVYVTTVINPKVIVTASTPITLTTTFGRVAYDTFTATQGTGNKIFTGAASSYGSAFAISNPSTNVGLLTVANNLPVGTYTFTATATDSVGATTNYILTVIVNPAPTIAGSPSNTLSTTVGRAASLRVNVIGGSGNRVISWTAPASGITIDTSTVSSQNYLTLNVSNTALVSDHTFSLTVTDSMSAQATGTFSVSINRWPRIANPAIVQGGLRIHLDAGNSGSYSGSGTTWTDLSGNGKNGTWQQSTTFRSASGGSIAMGSTTSQYMLSAGLGATNVLTVETWAKFNAIPAADNCIVSDRYTASFINFSICFRNDQKIYGGYWNGTNGWVTTAGTSIPVVNTWYHFAYTVSLSGSTYTSILYQNGVAVGTPVTSTVSPGSSNIGFLVGTNWRADTTVVNGDISIVRVYSKALTSSEVQQNYNVEALRFTSANSGSDSTTVTQGVAGAISNVLATQGTGTKTLAITNANAGVTIDTSTANAFTLNLANTLTSTSTTVARTITETVTATDAAGATTSRVYSIVINPPVRVESTTGTITTTSGIIAWDTFTATQGTGNKTFTLTGTPTATGFTLTQSNNQAVLRVEPTVNPGTYLLTITARDSLGATTSITKTVVVVPGPILIGSNSLITARGFAFRSLPYSVTNGIAPYTYTLTSRAVNPSNNLTTGITFETSTMTLRVTESVSAGTYVETLTVRDSRGATSSLVINLDVRPPAVLSGSLSITKSYGESSISNYTVSSATGVPPFTFTTSTPTVENVCAPITGTYIGNGTNGVLGRSYTYEKFTGFERCNWIAPAGVTSVDYVAVGGGGGGGNNRGGGGGGGGVAAGTGLSITPGTVYDIAVAQGGTATNDGNDSWIGNLGATTLFVKANGGGAGGSMSGDLATITGNDGRTGAATVRTAGGSGGGGGNNFNDGTARIGAGGGAGAGTFSGNVGGNSYRCDPSPPGYSNNSDGATTGTGGRTTGGGGGAGGAGVGFNWSTGCPTYNSALAPNGGAGVTSLLTGSAEVYGGGGGGADGRSLTKPSSEDGYRSNGGGFGAGGGGNGESLRDAAGENLSPARLATSGALNTGGGGGGGVSTAGSGGSGVVVVRYETPVVDSVTVQVNTVTNGSTSVDGSVVISIPERTPVGSITSKLIRLYQNGVYTNYLINVTINKETPTAVLSLPGSVTTVKYGTPVTISAVASTQGKVGFKNGSTDIAGCTEVVAVSGLATCEWTPSAVGATTINAVLTPTDTANYNSSREATLAVTVAKADTLTVTVLSQTETFTGSTIVATRAFTTSGLAAIDSLTAISMLFTGTANDGNAYSSTTAPTNAGTYSVAPNFPANAAACTFGVGSLGTTSAITNYESVTVVSGTLTVSRAPQVMAFTFANSNTVTYSPTATLASTATTRLGLGTRTYSSTTPITCSISETAVVTVLQAGSCSVQMAVALTANYEADTATTTVTINKASRTFSLTPGVSTLKYADTTTVTATLSGGAADGTISYTLGSPAGCTFDPLSGELVAISGTIQCPLTATISEGINYLAETSTAISLTIARANAPVITLDTVTALNHTPGIRAQIMPTFTIAGLKNLDTADALTYTYSFISNPFETFAYSDTRTPIDAGTYRITPSALTLSSGLMSNYETPTYSSSAINFVINRIAQETVTIQSVNGEVDVPFTLIATGGSTTGAITFAKVSGANCSVTGTTLTATQAGSCMVTVTRAGDRNYLPFTSESVTVRVRNFVMVQIFIPANPITGITITPSVPLTKGPDTCSTGCVPRITSADVYDVAEGDLIVLTGLSFNGVTKVYFNIYTEAPNFNIDSDTQLSVRVPADLPLGDATIEVVSPGGTSNRLFDFIILP